MDARNRIDALDWTAAETASATTAFTGYLAKHPRGLHVADAQAQVEWLDAVADLTGDAHVALGRGFMSMPGVVPVPDGLLDDVEDDEWVTCRSAVQFHKGDTVPVEMVGSAAGTNVWGLITVGSGKWKGRDKSLSRDVAALLASFPVLSIVDKAVVIPSVCKAKQAVTGGRIIANGKDRIVTRRAVQSGETFAALRLSASVLSLDQDTGNVPSVALFLDGANIKDEVRTWRTARNHAKVRSTH
jgi:hypothetical protein